MSGTATPCCGSCPPSAKPGTRLGADRPGGINALSQVGKCPRVLERSSSRVAAHRSCPGTVRVNGTVQADLVHCVRVQPAQDLRIAACPDNPDCYTRSSGPPSAWLGVIADNRNTRRGAGDAAVQPAGSRRPAAMIPHAPLSSRRQPPCGMNGGLSP